MKIFTSFVAMVITICTICSSVSTTTTAADINTTKNSMIAYLQQFETPYYGVASMDFDLNDDKIIDVFDLCLLKQKFVNKEDGVTLATVQKLQDWLLAKPDAQLDITVVEEPIYANEENAEDTEIIKNLMSNDFKFVHADYRDVDGYFGIAIHFIGVDEMVLETITFTAFTDTLEYAEAVIAEQPGFYITVQNGMYVLSFKERILSSDNNKDEEVNPETTTTKPITTATTTSTAPITSETTSTTTEEEPDVIPGWYWCSC